MVVDQSSAGHEASHESQTTKQLPNWSARRLTAYRERYRERLVGLSCDRASDPTRARRAARHLLQEGAQVVVMVLV
jgi:hypothetical protein